MLFPSPLIPATLLRRRQRFLADVRDDAGREFTALCPNTGRMLGYAMPGMRVWLSHRPEARGKYAWRWELGEAGGALVAVHPARANALAAEAAAAGVIVELTGYGAPRLEGAMEAKAAVSICCSRRRTARRATWRSRASLPSTSTAWRCSRMQ